MQKVKNIGRVHVSVDATGQEHDQRVHVSVDAKGQEHDQPKQDKSKRDLRFRRKYSSWSLLQSARGTLSLRGVRSGRGYQVMARIVNSSNNAIIRIKLHQQHSFTHAPAQSLWKRCWRMCTCPRQSSTASNGRRGCHTPCVSERMSHHKQPPLTAPARAEHTPCT